MIAVREDSRFLRNCLLASLALHGLAAYFSVGYHSADEQFQILEFLGYQLGLTPAKDLAVEFAEKMRPWLQPGIYYVLTRAMQLVGIESPHAWAFGFRLVTGLLGWLSLWALALRARDWIADPRTRRIAYLAIATLWFLPALQVRPSSESLSGSAFLLGACLLLARDPSTRLHALGGACLGLAFEARFQSGFLVAGLGAWLLLLGPRRGLGGWAAAALGFALIFGAGRLADFWGYGDWFFSPYRYVDFNLIRDKVNEFGVSPWWDVFRMSFTESWPLLGTLSLLLAIVAWVRHPLHPFTWAYVPLFAVHLMIPHKELRFFFPIAMALPLLMVMALAPRAGGRAEARLGALARVPRPLVALVLALNFAGLAALTFVPFARTVQFYEGVARVAPDGGAIELFFRDRDPYEILGTPIGFYRPAGLRTTRLTDYTELAGRGQTWLFTEKPRLPEPLASQCQLAYRTLPAWIERFGFELNGQNWVERTNVWTLWSCAG